mgnify:FL=1
MRPSYLNNLLSPINLVTGIGPKIEKLFNRIDINLKVHFLWHLPYNIIKRQKHENIHDAQINTLVTLKIKVLKHVPSRFKKQPYRVHCLCNETPIDIVFFYARHPVVKKNLPEEEIRFVSGKLEYFRNTYQITHPSHIIETTGINQIKNIEPIYSLTAGLSQKIISKYIEQIIKNIPNLNEWIDEFYLKKYRFSNWKNSIVRIHNPDKIEDTSNQNIYRRRLAFDELLAHQLAIAIIRNYNQKKKGIVISSNNKLYEKLLKNLKFKLTTSQKKVVEEITIDLESQNQMIRLLQGDVGSGKTVVALIAMLKTVESGYQSVLMVPTSILANQHFENFCDFLSDLNLNVEILTSKDKGNDRINKLKLIADGSINIIIGTHALIQEDVVFHKIGLAVIDEQHRFGVYQRMVFHYKGKRPSILVMSATPIPRTLALASYGDMDESRLTEKPLGRKTIKTTSLTLNKVNKLIERIKINIANSNSKFYWVCPLIEESEELDLKAATLRYQHLDKLFKNKVLLMHGQLNEKEKEQIMYKFINEDYRILVATTVIEVGIDIKSATTIIIEHAERFGLAQLHQLRGRVGRSNLDSFCILLHKEIIGDNAKKRINKMIETNDGFTIAEEDLKIRGEGEILGKKQSGLPSFKIAELSFDSDLLEDVRENVEKISKNNPKLENNEGEKLRSLLYLYERDAAIKTLLAG